MSTNRQSTWTPHESANFKAEAAGLFIEGLANSGRACRGLHRLLSAARRHGYGEVTIGGIKLGQEQLQEQQRQEQQHAQQHQGEQQRSGGEADTAPAKKRKPRKRSAAQQQKNQERWEAKLRARAQHAAQATSEVEDEDGMQQVQQPSGEQQALPSSLSPPASASDAAVVPYAPSPCESTYWMAAAETMMNWMATARSHT